MFILEISYHLSYGVTGIAGDGWYKETGMEQMIYICLPHDPDFAQSDFPIAVQSL